MSVKCFTMHFPRKPQVNLSRYNKIVAESSKIACSLPGNFFGVYEYSTLVLKEKFWVKCSLADAPELIRQLRAQLCKPKR